MSDSSSGAKSKRIPKSRAVPRILLSILQGLESPNKVTGFEQRESQRGYQLIVLSMRHCYCYLY